MACNNSTTFYWPGASFVSTPTIYSDPGFTTVAPDGFYQQAGMFRQMSGGILGSATTCPACLVPCDTTLAANGGQGQFFATANVGTTTGVVLVLFTVFNVPDKCTWSFDYDNSGTPTVASEYSSPSFGYMQGLIGTDSWSCGIPVDGVDPTMTNALGSSGLSITVDRYDYDPTLPSSSNFITPTSVGTQTLGPYDPQGTGTNPVDFTINSPNLAMMVIPKPLTTTDIIDLVVEGPCTSTGWNLWIGCPTQLNNFKCTPSPTPACTGATDPFFTAHIGNTTGFATSVSVHDWVFEDAFGVTKKAAGTYLVETGGVPLCVVVSSDGVVTSVANCVGNC